MTIDFAQAARNEEHAAQGAMYYGTQGDDWSWMDGEHPAWNRGELNPLPTAPGLPHEVADLVSRHTKAYAKYVEERDAAQRADVDLDIARRDDRGLAAAAAAANPDGEIPPPDAVTDAETALAAARRTALARRDAVVHIERDTRDALRRHAPTWLPVIREHIAQRDKEIGDLLTELEQLLMARATLRHAHFVIERAGAGGKFGPNPAGDETAWVAAARTQLGVLVHPIPRFPGTRPGGVYDKAIRPKRPAQPTNVS